MMFAALSIKEWTAIIVLATFALYIGIAWWSRAGSTGEFYVAAKSVSPWANGAEFCRGDHCQSVDSAAAGEDPGSGGGHPHTAGVGRTRSSRGCEYRPIDCYWSMYSQACTCCAAPALSWMGSRLISKSTGRPSTRLSNSSSDSRSVRWKK